MGTRPLKRLRWVLSWLIFPAILSGSLYGLALVLEQGVAPEYATAGIATLAGGLVLVLERIMPYTDDWLPGQGDFMTDATHTVFSTIGTSELLKTGLFAGAATGGVSWLSATLNTQIWPEHWPILFQLPLALIIGEFGQYWIHRWSHEHPLLWRLHATHHSPGRLYWLNAGRFHPLDTAIQYGGMFLPLAALGVGPEVMAYYALFTSIHGLHQHANIEMRLGPLNWIFSMAELHRWHHSRTIAEANNNYGANLIVWDIVFQTRYLPDDRLPSSDIGLSDMPEFPQRFWGQLLSPFRWKRYETDPD